MTPTDVELTIRLRVERRYRLRRLACPYCGAFALRRRRHVDTAHPIRDAMDDLDDAINALLRRGTDTIEREEALARILLAGSPFERPPVDPLRT